MTTSFTPVLEVAVFAVRSPDSFAEIQQRAHTALATLRGHCTGLRLRGGASGSFADVVAWESLEAAQSASVLVRDDPRFAPLMASIVELKLYAHYRVGADVVRLVDALRRAPLVEVAAYAVHDVAVHLAVHGQVHEAVRAEPGFRAGAGARQVEAPDAFADLVGWESAEAHHRAGAALQAQGALSAFFSGIGEMKVFELFSVLG